VSGATSVQGCVFCNAQTDAEAAAIQLYQGPTCYVILNLYPYNSGHLLIVPKRHVATLQAASHGELCELMELTRAAEMVLDEAYHPQGLNIGLNLGRSAGAGVLDHLHVHVVPRWTGDTNFMTVLGDVRVLPEELEQTAARLRPIFERVAREASSA
jgi:ATP adenylyltransferase